MRNQGSSLQNIEEVIEESYCSSLLFFRLLLLLFSLYVQIYSQYITAFYLKCQLVELRSVNFYLSTPNCLTVNGRSPILKI